MYVQGKSVKSVTNTMSGDYCMSQENRSIKYWLCERVWKLVSTIGQKNTNVAFYLIILTRSLVFME